MNVMLVNVCADNKWVLPFGKAHRKLLSQSIRFLWRYLSWCKRLTQVVCNNVVSATLTPGLLLIKLCCKKKLSVRNPAVALIAGDELALACLVWIFHIRDNIADCSSDASAFAAMQRNKSGSSQNITSFSPLFYCF